MYDVNNDNLNYDLSYICFVFCWVIYLQFLGYNMQSAIYVGPHIMSCVCCNVLFSPVQLVEYLDISWRRLSLFSGEVFGGKKRCNSITFLYYPVLLGIERYLQNLVCICLHCNLLQYLNALLKNAKHLTRRCKGLLSTIKRR